MISSNENCIHKSLIASGKNDVTNAQTICDKADIPPT